MARSRVEWRLPSLQPGTTWPLPPATLGFALLPGGEAVAVASATTVVEAVAVAAVLVIVPQDGVVRAGAAILRLLAGVWGTGCRQACQAVLSDVALCLCLEVDERVKTKTYSLHSNGVM